MPDPGGQTLKIVLHLGAHKTASTYIQTRLDDTRAELAHRGVALALVPEIRAAIKAKLDKPRLLRLTSSRPSALMASEIARQIALAADHGVQRLIISEENLLGPMNRLLRPVPVYDFAARRLTALLPHVQAHDLSIAISVRNYATFYRSVWGFEIREYYRPFDASLKAQLMGRKGEWVGMIQGVTRVFGAEVPVMLWTYEDFPVIEQKVFAALVEAEKGIRIEPSAQRPLQGPSAAAIRRLDRIAGTEPITPQIVKRVLRVKSQDKGFAAYDPWSKEERSRLDARYIEDLGAIFQFPNVVPIRRDDPTA